MTTLEKWAFDWDIHPVALADLSQRLSQLLSVELGGTSEVGVSQRVRVEYARKGALLFRNNVGACLDERGIPIRFGLANESKQLNRNLKSSDLIGVNPVTITQDMVGTVIGQFIAIETKRPNWKYTNTPHEQAQLSFLKLIESKGGKGEFIS